MPGLYLGRAEQHAFIEVNERGTEAAAATSLVGMVSAEQTPVPVRASSTPAVIRGSRTPTRLFRADRPFAFAIVHPPTGLRPFVGRATDLPSTNG